jgi:hypothetical protein
VIEIDLYNLHLGPERPPETLCHQKVGPFEVHLLNDYEEAVKSVFRPAFANVTWNWTRLDPQPPGLDPSTVAGTAVQSVTHVDEVRGNWVVTAKATMTEPPSDQSLLTRSPTDDGGIWDLCELLTFITGRRVLTHDLLERFDPNRAGEPVCVQAETLLAASVAWDHRKALSDRGLAYALLSHDSAIEYMFLQPKAAQYNTALNVVIDKWPLPRQPKVREALAKAVEGVVAACEGLSEEQRKGYTALLRAKAMDGPYSMLDRLILLLRDLGVLLPDDGDAVMTRVRYLNTVRNRLTHSGEMPLLKGMTSEQSDRYTVNIVGGVLQELNQLALGRVLGFTAGGAGSRSQDTADLRRFFTEGVWHNHPIELKDYHEWIEDPFSMG